MGLSTALPKSRGLFYTWTFANPRKIRDTKLHQPNPNPTMTLRDRRADKKNALTLICLFNLDNIKSTI